VVLEIAKKSSRRRKKSLRLKAENKQLRKQIAELSDPMTRPSASRSDSELNSSQNTTISAIVILGRFQLNHLWLKMGRILGEKEEGGK
jgi:hypothetical protein